MKKKNHGRVRTNISLITEKYDSKFDKFVGKYMCVSCKTRMYVASDLVHVEVEKTNNPEEEDVYSTDEEEDDVSRWCVAVHLFNGKLISHLKGNFGDRIRKNFYCSCLWWNRGYRQETRVFHKFAKRYRFVTNISWETVSVGKAIFQKNSFSSLHQRRAWKA